MWVKTQSTRVACKFRRQLIDKLGVYSMLTTGHQTIIGERQWQNGHSGGGERACAYENGTSVAQMYFPALLLSAKLNLHHLQL